MSDEAVIKRPQPGPQEQAAACRATCAVVGGSFFGGKSMFILMEAGRNVDHPKYRGVVFRRTYKQITDAGGLADIASNLYLPMGAVPTEKRTIWTFPSGSQIKFNHLEHDTDIMNYRSSQFCFLGIDQIEEFPESAFYYLRARNRPAPGYDRKCYFRASCNPEPGWLSEFIQWWWDPETGYPIKERSGVIRYFIRKDGQIIWVDKDYTETIRGGIVIHPTSFTFIPSTANDNPAGLKNDPNYQSNIAAMDAVSVERYMHGNWKVNFAGGMFQEKWFKKIRLDQVPPGIKKVRYWDFAASEVKDGKDPDWTAGALCGIAGGDFYIIDIISFREAPGTTEKKLLEAAEADGKDVAVRWEEEKGSAGKFNSHHLTGKLLGYDAQPDPVSGDKVERAKPLSAAAQGGRVYIVEGPWNAKFLTNAASFPKLKRDEIDAADGAMKCLTSEKRVWNSFSISKAKKLDIDWTQTSEYSTLYGAYYLAKNGTLYFLAGIWDGLSGNLFIYHGCKYATLNTQLIAFEGIKILRMRKPVRMQLVGNDLLCSDPGNRSAVQVLSKEFKKQGVTWNIHAPIAYDFYGSITYAGALFSTEALFVDSRQIEAVAQFASWHYKEGDKAPADGYEFAQCLCIMVAELKGVLAREQRKYKPADYAPREKKEESKESWATT